MEMKLASEHITFPKNFSLQQMAKHSLAKKFWGEFVLKETIYRYKMFDSFSEIVALHRKAVLDNVVRAFSTYLPGKLMNEMLHAVIDLQEGYRKVDNWEYKYSCALTFTILNPLTAGSYAAGFFISPGGHFDDLSWAKKFVSDENQCVQKRFLFACFYCFEDQILHLWHTMKTNGQLLCNGNLGEMKGLGRLVAVWASQIENKFHEYDDYLDTDDEDEDPIKTFNICGFNAAAYEFHKHATRFFWARSSDMEKRYVVKISDIYFLSDAAYGEVSDAEFVHFIYSYIFTAEIKKRFIIRYMKLLSFNGMEYILAQIWCCLLRSQYWESILKEILTLPYSIPSNIYYETVYAFLKELQEYQTPLHKEIVKMIWNKFYQLQENVVHKSIILIGELTDINAIDLLEVIIEPLRASEKAILLKEYPHKAIAPIVAFSNADNYDGVLRYLLAFLIDRSQTNQNMLFYADRVLHYMQQILKCHKDEFVEEKKNEVEKVIDCVHGSIHVLHHLLEKVENDSGRKSTSY